MEESIKTLDMKYPEAVQKLHQSGFWGIAEMARHFVHQSNMALELGLHKGSCSNWFSMGRSPNFKAEKAARAWLRTHQKTIQMGAELVPANPQPEAPQIKPDPEQKEDLLMLISGTPARIAKLKQAARMLGLELLVLDGED